MKIHSPIALGIVLILAATFTAGPSLQTSAQESVSKTIPAQVTDTIPAQVTDDPDLDEAQVWQGRIVKIVGRDLIVRIEGEQETFDVSSDVDIRKNRRRAKLSSLAPRDFATLVTVGDGNRERVKKIRAFSVR